MLRYGAALTGAVMLTAALGDAGPHAMALSLVGGAVLGFSPSLRDPHDGGAQLASM